MTEGLFKIGDRVDCSLTGLVKYEGLWYALYPGTIVDTIDEEGLQYFVTLDNYRSLVLKKHRLSLPRNDRCKYMPLIGSHVHVLENDIDVPVWWEAMVTNITWIPKCKIQVNWLGKYKDHENTSDSIPLDCVRPAMAPMVADVAIVPSCFYCKDQGEKNRPYFGNHVQCRSCFVEDKVDPILTAFQERRAASHDYELPVNYNWKQRQLILTRALIVQRGGQNARRDKRLQKKLMDLVKWMDKHLPEHPDEQEWEPSY